VGADGGEGGGGRREGAYVYAAAKNAGSARNKLKTPRDNTIASDRPRRKKKIKEKKTKAQRMAEPTEGGKSGARGGGKINTKGDPVG